ncbi:MAG: phage tail protein [Pseudomonadota bacterium]
MRTIQGGAIQGRGGGGKSGGGGGGREAPNTLRSIATARIIDVVSEGPIGGLKDNLKSVFLDDTPLQHQDDSFSVEGVVVWGRTGLPDQPHVEGFTEIEREIPVGVAVTKDSPEASGSGDGSVTRQVTDPTVDAVRVKARFPNGLSWVRDNGDIVRSFVDLAIDVMPNGGVWTEALTDRVLGKTTSPYERAYRIALPEGGAPWQVRMRRVTEDRVSVKEVDSLFWASYTELIDAKLQYPDTAFAAVSADAEAFGGRVPTRNYEIYGLLVDVPSNYDPQTRQYTGLWDGTFKTEWTDNPAWVLYALLTNRRWGLGDFIDAAQVDKFAFYDIAQYNDELVDDGLGGQEPRYTFNGVVEGREDAIRAVQLVAGSFRGITHWASGAVTVSQDKPADPVKLVTPANVIDGLFTYSGTGLKTRPTVALVSWHDPDDGYKAAIEVVEDPARIAEYGWRPAEIKAVGCTRRGQAYRTGLWALDTAWNQTETVTYRASWDHADVGPGDIVSIADPAYAGTRQGGRVVTSGTTGLTIDAGVSIDGVSTYTLSVVMPDGSIEDRTLTNGAGDHTTLAWTTALAEAPVPGAVWIVSPVAPRQFRILSVVEAEANIFEITALLHDPNKYARIEQGLVLDIPTFTALPSGALKKPINPSHSEYLYKPAATILTAVTFSWEAPGDARVTLFEVEVKPTDGRAFQPAGTTSSLSIDIAPTEDGPWEFRVRSLDNLGRVSPWATYQATLGVLDGPPSDVQNFTISVVGSIATLSWDPVPDLNLSHYRIKRSPRTDGPGWGEAVDIQPRVEGTVVQIAANSGTFLIKAVTEQGTESVNATSIVSTIGSVEGLNVVETATEDPAFVGTKAQTMVVTGNLRLAEQLPGVFYASGQYDFATDVDLGAVYTSRVSADVNASGLNNQNVMSSWASLAAVESLSGTTASEWDAEVQLRFTSEDPGGSPVWSAWQTLVIGDYAARAFEFRILLSGISTNISPNIIDLEVTVDMPDRIEAGDDLIVPAGGLRIDFAPAFRVLSGLGTAAQDMATGDRVAITNKSRTGFDVRFFDNGGVGVQRTLDYVAKGYGYAG